MPSLASFPNKRTSLSYEEFCDLYDTAYKSTMADDAMITAIFEMFDYDKNGKIDVVNIKQMLEVFGFKINSQDVRSSLPSPRRLAAKRHHGEHHFRERVQSLL